VIWALTELFGFDYLGFLPSIPGISERLIERVAGSLAEGGLPYTPLLALSGVPLKLYAALAFSLGASLGSVLLWTVFARIVRIAPTFAITAAIGAPLRRAIDARPALWTALLAVFWVAFYAFYLVRMSRI
jgi:hypothetical protein